MGEPDEALLFRYFNEIGIISALASTSFERLLPGGLTLSQFTVLNWFIRVDTEASPGRLAKAFQVTGGAMTNTLKKLEAKGLILIEPDPHSGRQKRVTLTDAGKQLREQAISDAFPLLRELAEALDTNAIRQQLPQLEQVRQYLDESRYQKP
ncbi:MAG: MarR family transcriptional regulator [Pseudohongiellaceae bacterium]|jgi:DNA-binding MarR family transcriptional regulator